MEGPTEDPDVEALRARQKRNFLATLLLSQGVPMISHGDELGRTQGGNNNVYCQDNEISWVDWGDARNQDVLTNFTSSLTRLRAEHPIFRRRRFFTGEPAGDSKVPGIAWLRRDGGPMTAGDWSARSGMTMTVFLNGHGIPERDAPGGPTGRPGSTRSGSRSWTTRSSCCSIRWAIGSRSPSRRASSGGPGRSW